MTINHLVALLYPLASTIFIFQPFPFPVIQYLLTRDKTHPFPKEILIGDGNENEG
jgi:hypothetical protein